MNRRQRPLDTHRPQVRASRLGMHVAFIALFAVLGGALRGLNLLVILAGLLLGLLLIQWRVCMRTLEGVRLRRSLPREAVAGEPFQVSLLVSNVNLWLPTWLLAIEDPIEAAGQSAPPARGRAGISSLPPRSTVPLQYECVIARRGCYRFGPATLSSGFPFGLFIARHPTAAPVSEPLYVYPRLLQLRPSWRTLLDARSGGPTATRSQSGPSEGDFYGLRDWQHGDSRRWIHWRTTARTEHPAVRQFDRQRRYEMCILVDAARLGDSSADELAVERTISLAATFVTHLAAIPGTRVTLVTAGRQVCSMQVTGMPDTGRQALRMLAELQPVAAPPLAQALIRAMHSEGGRNRPVLILSPRGASSRHLLAGTPGDAAGTPPPRLPGLGHLDLRWLDIHGDAAQRMVVWENADATA